MIFLLKISTKNKCLVACVLYLNNVINFNYNKIKNNKMTKKQ